MKTGDAGSSVLGATNAEAHGGDVLFVEPPSSNELAAAQLPPIRYIADHFPIASLLICRDRYPNSLFSMNILHITLQNSYEAA